MDSKKDLSERDICTKFIQPALEKAGWDTLTQIREEVSFTDGRIYVRGNLTSRGKQKRADYILYYKPNIPMANSTHKCNTVFKEIVFFHHFSKDLERGLKSQTFSGTIIH